jgi:two-component system, OmpR family, sensor histidine kinase CpxA
VKLRLSTKILLLALTNLVVLGLLFVIFLRLQVGAELESLLMAPARDRIQAIANGLALEIRNVRLPEDNDRVNAILDQYSKRHGLLFYLSDNNGHRLAGPEIHIPSAVMRHLTERPPRLPENQPHPKKKDGKGKAFRPPGNGQIFLVTAEEDPRYWVGARIPVPHPDGEGIIPSTLFLISPTLLGNRFFFDYRPWLIISASAIGLSVLCWLPFIRSLTRSIQALSEATGQIAKGHFEIQLPKTRHDELGMLSDSIQSMSTQLSRFVSGHKRFLGDVSHELCAPLARLQFTAGILESRTTPETEEYIQDLHQELQHISSLINELMAFSKVGLQPEKVKLEPVNLSDLIGRVLTREGQGQQNLIIRVPENLEVIAAPDFLFRGLSNLLRNAIRYAGQAGPIELEARPLGPVIEIILLDQGPGLPEDDAQRPVGGHGLGLQIATACVEACQGSLQFQNRKPKGLQVSIRLRAT